MRMAWKLPGLDRQKPLVSSKFADWPNENCGVVIRSPVSPTVPIRTMNSKGFGCWCWVWDWSELKVSGWKGISNNAHSEHSIAHPILWKRVIKAPTGFCNKIDLCTIFVEPPWQSILTNPYWLYSDPARQVELSWEWSCGRFILSLNAKHLSCLSRAPPGADWWFNRSSKGHIISCPDLSGKARLPTAAKAQRTSCAMLWRGS